jgi:hypothetical protein
MNLTQYKTLVPALASAIVLFAEATGHKVDSKYVSDFLNGIITGVSLVGTLYGIVKNHFFKKG